MSNIVKLQELPESLYGGEAYLDVIAAVREEFPNPRDIVLIDTNSPKIISLESTLKRSNIFIMSSEDSGADNARGAGTAVYVLLNVDMLSQNAAGINFAANDWVREAAQKYELQNFTVLVKGTKMNQLNELRKTANLLNLSGQITYRFPVLLKEQTKLFEDGIYINPWADKLTELAGRSALTAPGLDSVLSDLESAIDGKVDGIPKRRLQSTCGIQGTYLTWLLAYETIQQDLSPVYHESFMRALDEFKLMYPLSQMSLLERIQFVHSLPTKFGFASSNGQLISICTRNIESLDRGVIMPNVYEVFDYKTGKPIIDPSSNAHKDNIDWHTIKLHSYEECFSKTVLSGSHLSLESAGSPTQKDAQADVVLCHKFCEMAKYIGDPEMFPTVRNTVLAEIDDFVDGTSSHNSTAISNGETQKRYVVIYAPELIGLSVIVTSTELGSCPMVLTEEMLHRVLDYKFARSMMYRVNNDIDIDASLAASTELVENLSRTLDPAVPPLQLIRAALCPPDNNGLTYYQRGLRVEKPVMPIINDARSEYFYHVFDYEHGLSAREVMWDNLKANRYSLTCFGGLRTGMNAVYVTSNLWRRYHG